MDCVERNGHKLINADIFAGLSIIEDKSVDLIFIDPPYNIGKDFKTTRDKWTEDIMVEAKSGAKRHLIDYRKAVPALYNSRKVPGNVWEFPRVRYRMEEYENHPSQKPVALLERIIKASSKEGHLILDPFAGTFTASYVASILNRRSIGIEICPDYYHIGLRRVLNMSEYCGVSLLRKPKSYEIKHNMLGKDLFDSQKAPGKSL